MKHTEHVLIGILFVMVAVLTVIVFLPKIDNVRDQKVATTPSTLVANEVDPLETTAQEMINGQVEYVEGAVERRSGVDDGWRELEGGEIVKTGDDVRTLASSRAVVTFEDGSVVRLSENTQMTVANGASEIAIILGSGEVFNKVAKDDTRIYSVDVNGTKVTALGTAFDVAKADDGTPVVVVLESAVEIANGEGESIGKVSEGEKSEVKDGKVEKGDLDDADLTKSFIAWNIEKDKMNKEEIKKKKKEDLKEQKKDGEEKEVKKGGVISLYGKSSDTGVKLSWEADSASAPHGYKVIRSTGKNPVYPGDKAVYLSDKNTRSYHWETTGGKVYYFRVCAYNGDGGCLTYSNDVAVEAPESSSKNDKKDKEESGDYASSVSLSAKAKDDKRVKLEWSISGGDAPKGFKIVTSREKNPKYPGDTYKYLSESEVRNYVWEKGLKEGKTYYFRVCVYRGGECGAYSNNVSVKIED